MKKSYKHILAILAIVCMIGSLSTLTFAADAKPLIINSKTIEEITVSGSADAVTVSSGSYAIKSTDTSTSSCGSTQYFKKTNTITFTNRGYAGWIKITYTINGTQGAGSGGSYSLTAVSNCTVDSENGVITLSPNGSFSIAVSSSNHNKGSTNGNYTATFKPTKIEYEKLTPEIGFETPAEHGTYTVKDADGNAVTLGDTAKSSSYTLTASPASGYAVFRWVFTASDGTVNYMAEKSSTLTHTASVPGTFTCEFMKSDSAIYEVNGAKYTYFDQALTAASSSGTIALAGSGTMYGYRGQTEFTINNGVTLVLPYIAGKTAVEKSDADFPYANYNSGTSYSAQPGGRDSSRTYYLTIPSGTTVKNNGIIAVGGTIQGNGTMSGNHSNLQVNGTLELKSSTSVLSAVGYVYGTGSVVADGSGAKIFQPLSLHRPGGWGWSNAYAGSSMGGGLITSPEDGYMGLNASPRYTTQAIQCRLEMEYGDIMYGYADQHENGKHYCCTVVLIGDDKDSSLIALKSGASLVSTYDSSKTSSLYTAIGKLTIEITGGATQGTIKLEMSGYTLALNAWDFPVPYNYDLILKSGEYDLQFDMSLLPGAGLKIDSDAKLTIPSGVKLAVFTGANDHSTNPKGKEGNFINPPPYSDVDYTKSYNGGTTASPYYPVNSTLAKVSTLNGVAGGSMMANFIVDGTLDVSSGAYFGGIVQTNGDGLVIMNGVTANASDKDYVFTRQLGLTGHIKEVNPLDATKWASAGATIYKFYPQYFDETGVLRTMESGKNYGGSNANSNTVESFTFDLYTSSADVSAKTTHSETINATAMGQWHAHVYTSEVTKQPTCTEKGIKTYTCSCGHSYTEDIQATGHNMKETQAAVAATCTADGKTAVMTCQNGCGHTEGGATIPALGHKWNAATCTAPKTCSVCSATEGEATGHTWTDATCTAPKTCSVCGETEGEAKGHTPGATATCTTAQICTVCSAELVAAKGHSYNAVITAPTCSDKGYTTHTCTNCGDTYTDSETAAHGHTWTDATCTAPKTCSVCGATEGEALGHSYNAVITAPTVDAQGYTTHTCTCCGDSYVDSYVDKLIAAAEVNGTKYETLAAAVAAAKSGDTITLLGDVTVTDPVVIPNDATLDFDGKTASGTILGCLDLNGGTLVTAQGYKMIGPDADYYRSVDAVFTMTDVNGSITVHSGTITQAQNLWWTGQGQTLTIDECATFEIPAGCQLNVLSTVTVNGTAIVDGTVNLYSADATIRAAEGLNVITTAGDTVLYENGMYVVHNHDYNSVVTAPTCTEGGYTTHTCACGNTYTDNVTEATGQHNYVNGECACGAKDPEAVFEPVVDNGSGETEVATTKDENGTVSYSFKAGTSIQAPTVTITSPVGGWKKGEENVFTVSSDNDIACVVLVKDAAGKYTRLLATTTDDVHSFTLSADFSEECEIIVAVKGDADGNGFISTADNTEISRSLLPSDGTNRRYKALSELGEMTADADGNGFISTADNTEISRSLLPSDGTNRRYKAIEW